MVVTEEDMRAPFFRPLQGVVKQMNSLARIESHPLAGGLPRSNSWGERGGGNERVIWGALERLFPRL